MNTLFDRLSLATISEELVKQLTRSIANYTVLPLLLISQFAFANEISRSEVQQVTVNLGEKISFHSSNLNEQREFYVRLPEGYLQTKRNYPVIYLLDANNETLTYMDDLYFHSVTQIERLMQHGDIPESIIVGLPFNSSHWYSNVISNPKPFRDYLTNELSQYIRDHYRTLNNSTLVGQSYSAVFVINTLPSSDQSFNSYIAIEPVLASGELEKAIANYQGISVADSRLQIITGGAIMLHETVELSRQIANSNAKGVHVSLETFPQESHGSVYYPALNSALRTQFKDYRQPGEELILSANFDHQQLLNYYAKRASKYQVETPDRQFQSAVFDSIFYYLKEKKFEQAFDLWPVWHSPYKVYNANRIISHFIRNNDRASAIELLQNMVAAMPGSVSSFDRLATLYQQDQQIEQAQIYRLKVQALLTDIFSKQPSPQQEASLNRYGYQLLNEQRNQAAISLFKRITQANPQSINAYDSLADAYESTKNYPEAIKAQEQTVALAKNKENVNISSFQQKLNRLKNTVNAD